MDRSTVLAYAAEHGDAAAAERYGIARTTVRVWRHRAASQSRDGLPATPAQPPRSAAETAPPAAMLGRTGGKVRQFQAPVTGELPPWQPDCARCGDAGWLPVNTPGAVARAPALAGLRYSKRVTCPDCGDVQRRAVVVGANLRLAMQAAAADRADVRADEARAHG